MHEGISWGLVQRFLIDSPSYDSNGDDNNVVLTEDNADNILRLVNNMT